MSSETMPVLCGSIASFELLMTKWERLGEEHPELRYWTRIGLHWAQKYYKRMDNTDAYVIAMSKSPRSDYSVIDSHNGHSTSKVLNPSIRMSWIQREWDLDYIERAKTAMLDLVST
jgi:hypothetical protein